MPLQQLVPFWIFFLASIWPCAPTFAQHDVRMREIERAAIKPKHLMVLDAVPADALNGQLPQASDQRRFVAGARRGCAPANFAFCEELAGISRAELIRIWNEAPDDRMKRAVYVAVERSATADEINWSGAHANFDLWKMEFDDPGYLDRARAYSRRPTATFESNCALDTWREKVGGLSRLRSRVYCW